MENLIIRELNIWQEDPNNYLNPNLYENGYRFDCPPLQIISNWYNGTNPNKLLILGLEPHLNNDSFETQMNWLHEGVLDNLDIERYMNWQLNYFNNIDNFGPNILNQPYWNSVKRYLNGFCNVEITNHNIGDYCIGLDIIPMHAINHNYNLNDDQIRNLFIEKLRLIGSEKALFLSSNKAYRAMLEHLFDQEAVLLNNEDNVASYLINVNMHNLKMKLFIRPQPAAAILGNNHNNMIAFGEFIRNHN